MSSISTPPPQLLSGTLPRAARNHMIWKEFRQVLPLLIIFLATMIVMLIITSMIKRPTPNAGWFGPIWMLTNFFAVTIGVFLFSPEKENRTVQMLRHLPISSGFAVRTKLGVGLMAILLFTLIGALCCLFEVFVLGSPFDMTPSADNRSSDLALTIFFAISVPLECFLWGSLCSLTLKRAIVSIIVAIGCILLAWWIPAWATFLLDDSPGLLQPETRSMVAVFATTKALVYLVLIGGLVHGGSRWLNDVSIEHRPFKLGRWRRIASETTTSTSSISTPFSVASSQPSTSRIYCSLIWQSFLQFRSVALWASVCVIPFLLLAGLSFFLNPRGQIRPIWIYDLFVTVTLIGSLFAFSKDHSDSNYRFFQQHREFGRKLWFARLLPAALMALVCTVILGSLISWFPERLVSRHWVVFWITRPQAILVMTILIFTVFAIGQFCSMFFRSGVFSFVFMSVMSAFAAVWLYWLVYLGVDYRFLLSVPVAMVAITWWRAPYWLADRNRIRDYAIPWLALAGVVGGTVASFVVHRVSEIPQIVTATEYASTVYTENYQNQKSLIQYKRPQLFQEAAKLASLNVLHFQRADQKAYSDAIDFASIPRSDSDSDASYKIKLDEFVARNQASLDLIRETDDVKTFGSYLDPTSTQSRFEHVSTIRLLIATVARHHELNGDLGQALTCWLRLLRFDHEHPVRTFQAAASDCLIRWSRLPDQDVTLIRKAIAALDCDRQQWLDRANAKRHANQLDFDNWIEEFEETQGESQNFANHTVTVNNWPVYMPWETERCKRITRIRISNDEIAQARFTPFAIHSDHAFGDIWGYKYPSVFVSVLGGRPHPTHPDAPEYFSILGYNDAVEVRETLVEIQKTRYAQVQMALAAWRVDHPEYPERLDLLVPEFLERLPQDVFYGGQFVYSAQGKDAKVGWAMNALRIRDLQKTYFGRRKGQEQIVVEQKRFNDLLDPGTPFLLPWSTYGPPVLSTHWHFVANQKTPFQCYLYGDPSNYIDGLMHSSVVPLKQPDTE